MTDHYGKETGASAEERGIGARQFLRERQAYWAAAMGAVVDLSTDTLDASLQAVADRQANSVRDGDYLREGVFKYEAKVEETRFALTRQIINRVMPGPCEDPHYLEMLARQAASIELFLQAPRAESGAEVPPETLSRILIGTTGEPRSEGYSARVGGMAIIAVSAGMMDFLYQTSKAVVLSWKPTKAPKDAAVSFSGLARDTEEVLNKDPYPANLFYDTLSTWLYEGRPRAIYAKPPPQDYQWPLALLINGAERFVVAHEYGHALMHQLDLSPDGRPIPENPKSPWDRELQADAFGVTAVAQSSATLDLLPTNMALQGSIVAMKAHQIFDAAVGVAMTGKQAVETGGRTHPPFSQRIGLLEEFYLTSHPDRSVAQEDMTGMLIPSQTIDQLWERTVPRLHAQFRAGRPMHRIWSMPGP